ncbi:nicotinate phosphoribosyltransferase-like [Saccoglossus kowalevskii]|uniref:Nicotinate phosphoribosyltransferase n=1 Tax=Saccoglossus kowalevskii TaxID=10224 RepID=A0ABM0GS88_SACKO|nr:PREDICTED: nicotinate phosphoribosyltransferase-like [Saccoglossus kowalevskii]
MADGTVSDHKPGEIRRTFSTLSTGQDQNGVVQPLLTDLYQITMAYAHWKSEKRTDHAVFDLYFRKNPFRGEFTIFAGLHECLKFFNNYTFSKSDIDYLRTILPPSTEEGFFQYLSDMDLSQVTMYAIPEGSVVFPKVPLLRVEGPLPIVQLLETTLLTLVNYASLVATNAARFRMAAGPGKSLLEFGLRRAQGPDGGLSASKYCYIGGFDGTSNVLAGKLFNIPVKGTHAHAFVTSFTSLDDLKNRMLQPADQSKSLQNLVEMSQTWLDRIEGLLEILKEETHKGELASFISYAMAFPTGFLALVDTYDVLRSGIPNFVAVALSLHDLGYKSIGIRLDSGDLAYLSLRAREIFTKIADKYNLPWFAKLNIVASNDINEETIHSLNQQGHSIDTYGIGTHLVTCQRQPALGCVFKLVEVDGVARMKLSQDMEKMTLPGKKNVFRLYGHDGHALVDLMMQEKEEAPSPGQRVLCRHPFEESKRAYVIPASVEPLLKKYWFEGKICQPVQSLHDIKSRMESSLRSLRADHKRALNPTPYKVSVTAGLYQFMHDLWLHNAPIGELS